MIPTVISQIANGAREIELGSLHPTRDFSFVADTVQGFLCAAVADKAVGQVINTGSDFEISIGDLAKLIAEVMQADVKIKHAAERVRPEASEVERLRADVSLAGKVLGWKPEHGGRDGLARGLKKTVAWFSDPVNLGRYKSGRYNI